MQVGLDGLTVSFCNIQIVKEDGPDAEWEDQNHVWHEEEEGKEVESLVPRLHDDNLDNSLIEYVQVVRVSQHVEELIALHRLVVHIWNVEEA